MSLRPVLRSAVRTASISLVAVLFCVASRAQETKAQPTANEHSSLPVVDQELIIPYWTTETGWRSELQLRNNAVGHDLIVTPVLRLAYGAETSLAAVTIKSDEVKSVDLEAAISAANAPQLVGTYGSAVLRFRAPAFRSLYAA